MSSPVKRIFPLGFPWETQDPFLFCVYHLDHYPKGNEDMVKEDHTFSTGQVLHTKKEIRVAVPGGFIQLLEMQLAGKRKMKTQEILNGLKLSETAHMA